MVIEYYMTHKGYPEVTFYDDDGNIARDDGPSFISAIGEQRWDNEPCCSGLKIAYNGTYIWLFDDYVIEMAIDEHGKINKDRAELKYCHSYFRYWGLSRL